MGFLLCGAREAKRLHVWFHGADCSQGLPFAVPVIPPTVEALRRSTASLLASIGHSCGGSSAGSVGVAGLGDTEVGGSRHWGFGAE